VELMCWALPGKNEDHQFFAYSTLMWNHAD
jgi:hypothetical protein